MMIMNKAFPRVVSAFDEPRNNQFRDGTFIVNSGAGHCHVFLYPYTEEANSGLSLSRLKDTYIIFLERFYS